MKISQQMIAQRAGVSRGTVDRVLHGKPNVNPETRQKVLDAVKELNYTPNTVGRALALSKRKYSICAVMPDNSFFSDIRLGITKAINELSDYNISLSYIFTSGKNDAEIISEINANESMAFMVALPDKDEMRACIKEKTAKGIPFVTFNTDIKDCGRLCFVGQDLYKSGRIAASLMLKTLPKEQQKILIVTGNSNYKAHSDRVDGFQSVISSSKKQPIISQVIETKNNPRLTRELVGEALENDKDINAIYVASAHVEEFTQLLEEREKKYRVVINDLSPCIERALRNETIDFTILQDPHEQGYKPIKILFEHLFNKKLPEKEYFYTESTIITSESL